MKRIFRWLGNHIWDNHTWMFLSGGFAYASVYNFEDGNIAIGVLSVVISLLLYTKGRLVYDATRNI